jgi:hypothetical protein
VLPSVKEQAANKIGLAQLPGEMTAEQLLAKLGVPSDANAKKLAEGLLLHHETTEYRLVRLDGSDEFERVVYLKKDLPALPPDALPAADAFAALVEAEAKHQAQLDAPIFPRIDGLSEKTKT